MPLQQSCMWGTYAYFEDIQWSEQHPGHIQSNITLTQHNRSLSTKVRVQLQGVKMCIL